MRLLQVYGVVTGRYGVRGKGDSDDSRESVQESGVAVAPFCGNACDFGLEPAAGAVVVAAVVPEHDSDASAVLGAVT